MSYQVGGLRYTQVGLHTHTHELSVCWGQCWGGGAGTADFPTARFVIGLLVPYWYQRQPSWKPYQGPTTNAGSSGAVSQQQQRQQPTIATTATRVLSASYEQT
jgi:hypothetical protein